MAKKRIGIELIGPNQELFLIKARLGSGAFGEVYKAIGTKSQMIVAIKMVPAQKLNDPHTLAVRTVLNETRIDMLKINHPNVVRVVYVDIGSDPTVGPYLMMEFVAGGNLQNMIDGRRANCQEFTLDEALSRMRSIAMGAQAVNEHMIHRDIKPDNILIAGPVDAPQPKIADFGIAEDRIGIYASRDF